MLQRFCNSDQFNRRWPNGTRIYEFNISSEMIVKFEDLDHDTKQQIENIFNHKTLCAVRALKVDVNSGWSSVLYFIDTEDLMKLNDSLVSYLSECHMDFMTVSEGDLLSLMTIYDDKGNIYVKMNPNRYSDPLKMILASEIANSVLNEISELSVVRWIVVGDELESTIYLKLDDTKYICDKFGIETELSMAEDFSYSYLN